MKKLIVCVSLCTFFWGSAQALVQKNCSTEALLITTLKANGPAFKQNLPWKWKRPIDPSEQRFWKWISPKNALSLRLPKTEYIPLRYSKKESVHTGMREVLPFSDEIAQQQRFNCERTTKMRNYYVYLYGLPMKLKDPGTKIDPRRLQKPKRRKLLVH